MHRTTHADDRDSTEIPAGTSAGRNSEDHPAGRQDPLGSLHAAVGNQGVQSAAKQESPDGHASRPSADTRPAVSGERSESGEGTRTEPSEPAPETVRTRQTRTEQPRSERAPTSLGENVNPARPGAKTGTAVGEEPRRPPDKDERTTGAVGKRGPRQGDVTTTESSPTDTGEGRSSDRSAGNRRRDREAQWDPHWVVTGAPFGSKKERRWRDETSKFERSRAKRAVPVLSDVDADAAEKEADEPKNAATASTRTYTVEKGDTLWEVANSVYGDPTAWRAIATANDIENPRHLQAGTTLVVPNIGESDSGGGEQGAVGGGTRRHTVEKGQTLWEIASAYYGDPTEWTRIVDANDIDDPRGLEAGTAIVVPRVSERSDGGGDTESGIGSGTGDGSGVEIPGDVSTGRQSVVDVPIVGVPVGDGSGDTRRPDAGDGARTHTVEEGETVWEIANAVYGDPTKWPRIAKANDIDDPRAISAGQTLSIPKASGGSDGEGSSGSDGARGTTSVPIGTVPTGPEDSRDGLVDFSNVVPPAPKEEAEGSDKGTEDTPRTHTVEHGETLWDIAKAAYGDPTRWQAIAAANDIDDPRSLEAGTTLTIPSE